MKARFPVLLLASASLLVGQEAPAPSAPPAPSVPAPAAVEAAPTPSADFTISPGTHIPLSLVNSVSTRTAAPGDRVYLQTAFPVLDHGRIVIPVGSYVEGTVTQAKRPGRVKGRGELYIRFDSLTLPNGVTRDFHGR